MSLIHWWPLTANLKDKITSYTTGGTFQAGAVSPIGGCLHSTSPGFQTNIKLTDEWSHWKHSVSMSCWVRINFEECNTYCKKLNYTANATNPTGCLIGQTSYGGLGIYWRSNNNVYNGGNTTDITTINFRGYTRGSSTTQSTSAYTVEYDKWYHMTLVADYDKKVLRFYVNGTKIGNDMDYSPVPEMTDTRYFGWGRGEVYGGNGPGGYLPMDICDVRLYNHALSQQEIKELSQALVMHLTFNDEIGEGTTNIYYNKIKGFQGKWETLTETFNGFPVYRNTVTNPFTGSNQADNFGFCHTTTITHTQSQTTHPYITLSFWKRLHEGTGLSTMYGYVYVTYTDDTHVQLQWSNYNKPNWSNDATSIGKWEKITAVAKLATGKTIKNITHMYVYGRNCTGGICDFACIQIEAKDRPTPYVAGERPTHIVNETGYDDPFSVSNLSLSVDTNCGSYCGVFNSSLPTQIRMTPTFGGATDVSVACWIYPKDGTTAFTDNALYCVIAGTGINLYAYGRSNSWLSCANCLKTNSWNHVVVTYSATERVLYVNGSKVGSDTVSGSFETRASLDVGYGSTTTRAFNGRISDFRIYGTTLNQNDVKNLYESKASIDKENDVFSNEIIEEIGDNLVSVKTWEQGGIGDVTGNNVDGMNNRLRTKYIPVLGGLSYTFNCSSPCVLRCVHCYDKDNKWINALYGNTITLPENCAYVRWVIQDSNSNLNVPVANIKDYNPIMMPTLIYNSSAIVNSTEIEVSKKYTITTGGITENQQAGIYKDGKMTGRKFIEN